MSLPWAIGIAFISTVGLMVVVRVLTGDAGETGLIVGGIALFRVYLLENTRLDRS